MFNPRPLAAAERSGMDEQFPQVKIQPVDALGGDIPFEEADIFGAGRHIYVDIAVPDGLQKLSKACSTRLILM